MLTNYHTHSNYCDGKGTLRDFVLFALEHHFSALGFSGHCPLPFSNTFSIHDDQYSNYCQEVRALQAEFSGQITLRLGLEMDYVPGVLEDFTPLKEQGNLDYVIGSVHLVPTPEDVDILRQGTDDIAPHLWFIDGPRYETYDDGLQRLFHGDIRKGVRTFFHQTNTMIESQRPDIVGHLDKIVMHNRNRYFTADEPWFRDLLFETITLIHEKDLIAEINTRGLYKKRHFDYYPSKEALLFMKEKDIPVIVSTDAHQPSDLICFEGIHDYLASIHYPNIVTQI